MTQNVLIPTNLRKRGLSIRIYTQGCRKDHGICDISIFLQGVETEPAINESFSVMGTTWRYGNLYYEYTIEPEKDCYRNITARQNVTDLT